MIFKSVSCKIVRFIGFIEFTCFTLCFLLPISLAVQARIQKFSLPLSSATRLDSLSMTTEWTRQFIVRSGGNPGELFVSKKLPLPEQLTGLENQKAYLEKFWLQNKVDILDKYKQLSGEEFKSIYENRKYPDTISLNSVQTNTPQNNLQSNPQTITGNSQADVKIRLLAKQRGYVLRLLADEDYLENIDREQLQSKAKSAFISMQSEAAKSGVQIGLASGYRSVQAQRRLFVSRLLINKSIDQDINNFYQQIGDGLLDSVVIQTLSTTAPPGFSRHHTGYTIDLNDGVVGGVFKYTPSYIWLSQNNFYRAKQYGFIPSYPEDTEKQGPEPEPWEFVWVGRSQLVDTANSDLPTFETIL